MPRRCDAGLCPGEERAGKAGLDWQILRLQHTSKEASARPMRSQDHPSRGPHFAQTVSLPWPVTGWNQPWEAWLWCEFGGAFKRQQLGCQLITIPTTGDLKGAFLKPAQWYVTAIFFDWMKMGKEYQGRKESSLLQKVAIS